MKFATILIRYYPSHLSHVATLPWLRFDKFTDSLKAGTFLRHSVHSPRSEQHVLAATYDK